MTIAPRYHFDAGTEISVQGHSLVLHKVGDAGYELSDSGGNGINVLGFSEFVELAKSGGIKLHERTLSPQGSARVRLEGFSVAAQLTEKQQTYGRFHYAICIAIDQLYNHRTVVEGQNDFRISIGSLNNNANRKFLRQIVEAIFGERVYLECSSVKIHS